MLPSKVVSIEDSILWKLPYIIEALKKCDTLPELYSQVINKVHDINEFLFSLDILYALNIIDDYNEKGVVKYAERNNM